MLQLCLSQCVPVGFHPSQGRLCCGVTMQVSIHVNFKIEFFPVSIIVEWLIEIQDNQGSADPLIVWISCSKCHLLEVSSEPFYTVLSLHHYLHVPVDNWFYHILEIRKNLLLFFHLIVVSTVQKRSIIFWSRLCYLNSNIENVLVYFARKTYWLLFCELFP